MDTTYFFGNPDTLRYFYSSIFQGFAAIIALGAMFFLYYFEKMYNRKSKAEKTLLEELKKKVEEIKTNDEHREYLATEGEIKYVKQYILGRKEKHYDSIKKIYDNVIKIYQEEANIRNIIPITVLLNLSILVISLVSLFLLDVTKTMNCFFSYSGIFVIFLCLLYFRAIYLIICSTLGIKNVELTFRNHFLNARRKLRFLFFMK